MQFSIRPGAVCVLVVALLAAPVVPAQSPDTPGPQTAGSDAAALDQTATNQRNTDQRSADSKWLVPEKDGLLKAPGALPFYPHRANTTDNRRLPVEAFENAGDVCSSCHQDIYEQWRSSMMSQSWEDPIYRALLKRVSEATGGELDNFCTGCHTPPGLTTGQVTQDLTRTTSMQKASAEHPLPGVDCETCHNYSARTGQDNGAYVLTPMLNGKPTKFGPYKDAVSPYHDTVYSELHTRSDFCSVCHNVTHPFSSTAIERTYEEWHESPNAASGQQCQDCHMPKTAGKAAIMGPDRPDVATHFFNGGNVTLLTHFGQAGNAERSRELLKGAGTIEFADVPAFTPGGQSVVSVKVSNTGAGHKLPTGFPEGRQMWIDFTVSDASGVVVYRSGAVRDGKTEAGTQDYRVHLGDKEGNEVETDIWRVAGILSDTRLLPGGHDVRSFTVAIPAKAEGPFKLEARLNYWPFSQALADELLGAGTMPVEVVTVASADATAAVRPHREAAGHETMHAPAAPRPRPGRPRGAHRAALHVKVSAEPGDAANRNR